MSKVSKLITYSGNVFQALNKMHDITKLNILNIDFHKTDSVDTTSPNQSITVSVVVDIEGCNQDKTEKRIQKLEEDIRYICNYYDPTYFPNIDVYTNSGRYNTISDRSSEDREFEISNLYVEIEQLKKRLKEERENFHELNNRNNKLSEYVEQLKLVIEEFKSKLEETIKERNKFYQFYVDSYNNKAIKSLNNN